MNSKLNVPARATVFALLTLLVIAAALTLPKLSSGPVFAQIIPPPVPAAAPTAVAVGTQTVELTWEAPATGTVTGYKLERSTDAGVTWVVASANTGNDNLYYTDTHSSLAGKSVRYRVAAINSAGVGVYVASTTDVALPKAGMEPGTPTGLKATVMATDHTMVELSWSAPSQGASAISGYSVQWSANGEHTWTAVTTSGTGTTVTDTPVPAGTTRHYRVAATNGEGTGPYSASASVTTPPVGVPAVPAAAPTAVAVGTQTVELTWEAPATGTVTGYKLERSTDAGVTWVVASADTGNDNLYYSDTHSSLTGKSVRYRVAAINSVGVGPYVASTTDVTLPKAGTQPDAPTGLTVVATSATGVTLSWVAPSGTVTGYIVQWSETGKHTWTNVGTPTATTATDTIPAGAARYYRVAATNTGVTPNAGPYSAVSRVTVAGVPPVPAAAPTAVAVGTQTVELTWEAPATGTVTGYKLERSTDAGVTWVVASANTGNDNLYYTDTHSSLAGKSVRYRVAAINSAGVGVYVASTTDVALPKAGMEPGTPTGLKATVMATDHTMVELSWSAPSQGASAISGYSVQWSANGEHTWTAVTTSGTGTTVTDTPVPAGTTRHYRVAATNGEGTGPYSASASVTTPPVGVPAVPAAAPTAVAVGTQTVELTWEAPATGTVTGYKLERSTDAGVTWVVASADTGNDNLYYSDTHSSLTGKSVRYRVAAINSVGVGPYVASTTDVTLPKAGTQPDAPTGLTVVATSFTGVTLSWVAPSGTVTGYHVQYSETGEHTWLDTGITQPTSGTDTDITDTVPVGEARYYRVAAENTGVTPNRGPYSAVLRLGGPADEPGTVTLSTQEPMVGSAITATLMDDDGGVTGQMWQWQKSMDKDSWMDITGATAMGTMTSSYTPVAMDEDYYLRATVEYTDENRSGRMAESMATGSKVVPAAPSIPANLQKYDTNDNDRIEYLELVAVIEMYNAGDATYLDLVGVIDLYSAS